MFLLQFSLAFSLSGVEDTTFEKEIEIQKPLSSMYREPKPMEMYGGSRGIV